MFDEDDDGEYDNEEFDIIDVEGKYEFTSNYGDSDDDETYSENSTNLVGNELNSEYILIN